MTRRAAGPRTRFPSRPLKKKHVGRGRGRVKCWPRGGTRPTRNTVGQAAARSNVVVNKAPGRASSERGRRFVPSGHHAASEGPRGSVGGLLRLGKGGANVDTSLTPPCRVESARSLSRRWFQMSTCTPYNSELSERGYGRSEIISLDDFRRPPARGGGRCKLHPEVESAPVSKVQPDEEKLALSI